MGTFFQIYKVKKAALSEQERSAVVFDKYEMGDEEVVLVEDTIHDNLATVELHRVERFGGGPEVLREYFLSNGFSGGPFNTSMFMSPDLFTGLIEFMKKSELWEDLSSRDNAVQRLEQVLKEIDFETEYLLYNYW